jgi:hypothetical protein
MLAMRDVTSHAVELVSFADATTVAVLNACSPASLRHHDASDRLAHDESDRGHSG